MITIKRCLVTIPFHLLRLGGMLGLCFQVWQSSPSGEGYPGGPSCGGRPGPLPGQCAAPRQMLSSGRFWCPVVTLVTINSNLSDLTNNQKVRENSIL